jgi:hypothetical protein
MIDNTDENSFEHNFLKEMVTQVRNEFYKTGTKTDSDELIERLLITEGQHEAD